MGEVVALLRWRRGPTGAPSFATQASSMSPSTWTIVRGSRILEACRETGCAVLASATLLERLSGLPPGVTARALGPLPMRGKERAVELCALETPGAQRPRPTDCKSFSSSVP